MTVNRGGESEGWESPEHSEIGRQTSRPSVDSWTRGILATWQIFGPAFRSAARVSAQNMLCAPIGACAVGDIVIDMCSVTRAR